MKIYSITRWGSLYENNRTRDLKKMDWVPIPNKHDGDGYALMMDQDDGPALLGAWLAIIQVASKCDKRGTLLRDSGIPHDSASIARQCRFPREVIERAMDFFSDHELGWLEVSDCEEDGKDGAVIPHEGAATPQLVAKKGREGIEGNISPPNPPSRLPRFVDEAISGAAGRGVPDAFTREVFLEHEGTTWTYAGKPITNWPSYLCSRWMKVKSIQAERERYMTAPKKPFYKTPAVSRPQIVPPWMKDVEEIKRLLRDPDANAARLRVLGEAIPAEAWNLFDKLTEWNQLKQILKKTLCQP